MDNPLQEDNRSLLGFAAAASQTVKEVIRGFKGYSDDPKQVLSAEEAIDSALEEIEILHRMAATKQGYGWAVAVFELYTPTWRFYYDYRMNDVLHRLFVEALRLSRNRQAFAAIKRAHARTLARAA